MMQHRDSAALALVMALLSGCFQEEAPRHEALAAVAAEPAHLHASVQRAIETATVEDAARMPELATMLRDDADPEIRREAIFTIADVGETEDAAIIGQALYDPDGGVRLAAIEALTGIGGEASADWLSLDLGDSDPRVRQTAVEALGEIGGDTSRFLLQQALADADSRVREAAQQMLVEPALAQRDLR